MDYIQSVISGTGNSNESSVENQHQQQGDQKTTGEGGGGGGGEGFMGKINNAMGGGASGEAKGQSLPISVSSLVLVALVARQLWGQLKHRDADPLVIFLFSCRTIRLCRGLPRQGR